ncbi:MAG: SRPBCC family protein [Halobacteriaceae archaeon]
METLEIGTLVYLPPEEVFEFLIDFPGYARYSKYLQRVKTLSGDGGPGTEYALRFQWWKLSYTARSRVTSVDAPDRIDWEVTKDIDASGRWLLKEVEEAAGAETPQDTATCVKMVVDYDPSSVGRGIIDLPRFVSFSWVIDQVQDLIVEEGERVVERIVADLEGERRPVDLSVRTSTTSR